MPPKLKNTVGTFYKGADSLKVGCYTLFMRVILLFLVLFASCTKEKLPELYLLQGACEVQVKTDYKKSDIYLDGILIGHGEAKSKVPCGQKRIQIEAKGKWTIEDFQVAEAKLPLEVSYKLKDIKGVKNWAMSPELIAQLKKGQGPYDISNPNYKELAEARMKARNEQGYNFTSEELAVMAKKAAGSDDADAGGGAIQIDPNTNFDDPKTWM